MQHHGTLSVFCKWVTRHDHATLFFEMKISSSSPTTHLVMSCCWYSLPFLLCQTKSCISGGRGSSQRTNCVGEEGGGTPGTLYHPRRGEVWGPGQSQRECSGGRRGCTAEGPGHPVFFSLSVPSSCPHSFILCPLKCVSVFTLSLQALLREKQKAEELEKTKEAIKQLIQDAAVRTRKEVNGSLTNNCWAFSAKVRAQEFFTLKSILGSQLILPKALHVICFMCDKTLLKSTSKHWMMSRYLVPTLSLNSQRN